MKKLLFIVASALAMTACSTNSVEKQEVVPAIDAQNFDESIARNDDFYQWATGGWQKNNPLKPEYSRYGSFDVLRENNEIRINDLFSQMTKTEAEFGSVEQKISDLYKLGLDEERLNREGAEPIREALNKILAIEDRAELIASIAQLHTDGIGVFFGGYPAADLADSNMTIFYLDQAGLGMGNRDYYIDEKNAEIKAAYLVYLEKIFTLAGVEGDVKKMVADVVAIEDAIAEKSWSNVECRDIAKGYNPHTMAELREKYSAVDWDAYLAALGVADLEKIVVSQPSSLENIMNVIATTPVEALRAYVAAHYIDAAASYLSEEFAVASFEFFGKTMSGTQEIRPRWKRAMGVPNNVLSEAVGQMYVAKYFPESEKARVESMVFNIQKAFSKHIEALDWMSEETKAKAQEKLAAFTVKIGYPNKWKDYSTLTVDPAKSYWENVVEANRWYTADAMAEVGKPVDREKWLMPPQMVNAYYMPTTNEICFPAAILQPPFYNPNADDAVNYGAIGVVIAHEMTHGFDDQGSQFDKVGNMNDWWTAEDRAAFEAKTNILVEQFNAIEILPGLYADGKYSLGENIADQGGLRLAFTGLVDYAWANGRPEDIDGFTGEQRFYIGYATLWAQNITDQEKERLTKVDVHSLGRNRVNATLRNIQSFYDAFGITEADAMYMPVEERVIIW
ncbi:MAG: M13 family metallopeptidase [Alistipes sp.]|nr:M13 family metallopeptidase [Alistipes sp.]MBR6544269.1 M13 family metallopeptidase [Alistipes sp.]